MSVHFIAMPTQDAQKFRNGQLDALGKTPEHLTSDGAGYPCRHCLGEVPSGEPMLLLSYKPFASTQPYAEVGPIFLCGKNCERFEEQDKVPNIASRSPTYIVRAYDEDDRIIDGTGQVTVEDMVAGVADGLLSDSQASYVHLRSSSNNCYLCKIERA